MFNHFELIDSFELAAKQRQMFVACFEPPLSSDPADSSESTTEDSLSLRAKEHVDARKTYTFMDIVETITVSSTLLESDSKLVKPFGKKKILLKKSQKSQKISNFFSKTKS